MGFPLSSNIFDDRTLEHLYFSKFPVQVAVLFSPYDKEFTHTFKDLFLDLDIITGQNVIFFAILDPPNDWLVNTRDRFVWRRYWQNIRPTGFSYESSMLVREIARLFGVPWYSLPVIVVGTDLWGKDYLVVSTSSEEIKDQLENISFIAQRDEYFKTALIKKMLEEKYSYKVAYRLADKRLRNRLNKMYEVLSTSSGEFDSYKYYSLINDELTATQKELHKLRSKKISRDSGVFTDYDEISDIAEHERNALIEDISSRLVAPAAVAQKLYQHLICEITDLPEKLDEDSKVMLESAIRVGTFLELLREKHLSDPMFTRLNEELYDIMPFIDFTAGAQGIWKTYELEINLSIIQAARKARTIKMPDFFALYCASIPSSQTKVRTVKDDGSPGKIININQKDNEDIIGKRHRFLTLGNAWHVTSTLLNKPEETFQSEIINSLGRPLDDGFLRFWEEINKIRIVGSHIKPINYNEYKIVLQNILAPSTIEVLTTIKEQLRAISY